MLDPALNVAEVTRSAASQHTSLLPMSAARMLNNYDDKMPRANLEPNSIGPGGWGGDWYLWHAPDGLPARAATALECVQAGAEKLGVIEASYASAIIGVLSGPFHK